MNVNEMRSCLKNMTSNKCLTAEEYLNMHLRYIEQLKEKKPDDLYIIPIEEMAELQQQLCKLMRGNISARDISSASLQNLNNISDEVFMFMDEIVDVQICLDNIKCLLTIDPDFINALTKVKMERAQRRVNKQ